MTQFIGNQSGNQVSKDRPDRTRQTGYTLIEILGVATLVVIVVMMTQGMIRSYRRYSVEEIAVQRLKELARLENVFRHSNDPTVNPDGIYGTFFDLQNAGLIAEIYEQDDERRHTVNAFVPYYRLDFVRSDDDLHAVGKANEEDVQMDSYQYLIRAIPLYNSLDLRTFYVQEDGEVYHRYFFEVYFR